MAERSLIFPAEEFQARVTSLQREMDRRSCRALLLTSPADVFYVTGFLTRFWESPARPWFVVVPASGKPTAVIPSIGGHLMGRTWLTDIRTWDAPDPDDDGVSLLSETLREIVGDTGKVGVPMGLESSLRMPLADYAALEGRISPLVFTDATEIIQRVREIKSEAEVEKIRTTCRIADAAFGQTPDIIMETPQLDAIFRAFQIALLSAGADWVSYVAGGAGRGGYGDVIAPATDAPLRRGDIVMLDTGAVRDGYFCDFNRNFSVGSPDDDVCRAQEALIGATEIALDTIRPRMKASDVHRILTDALHSKGATPGGGRLGHGLGLTLTEWPSFTAMDQTELRENMVLTLEPSVEISPGRMLVHEEDIVLRSNGPELLSRRAPAELPEVHL